MRIVVREENNVQGALVMERLSYRVFPRYSKWDYISVMNYIRVGGKVLVAYDGYRILGGAFLRKMLDDMWELTMIGVFPEYRGMGVGRMLMEEVLRVAPGDIYLHVEVNNERAIRLYRAFGFEIVKRVKKFYSTGEDAYLMVLKRTPRRPENASEGSG